MTAPSDSDDSRQKSAPPSRRLRLPGFIVDDEIGLGAAIERATSYVGLRPCGGCERRARALDRWIAFTR